MKKIVLTLLIIFLSVFVINYVHAATRTISPKSLKNLTVGGDADDPAVWIDETDKFNSLIFLSDKSKGVYVYDFRGNQVQHVDFGTALNNIDVRKGFNFNGQQIDILSGNLRDAGKLAVLKINPNWTPGNVLTVLSDKNSSGNDISADSYGFALYKSTKTGKMYVFEKPKSNKPIVQWLVDGSTGSIKLTNVREITGYGVSEGFVADDELGFIYLTEEAGSINKYNAEPDGGTTPVSSFGTDVSKADREGVSLYKCNDGTGYLMLSSQGDDTFPIFERQGNNKYTGITLKSTDASSTDSIELSSAAMPDFPGGFMILHDGGAGYDAYDWRDAALADLLVCPDGVVSGSTPTVKPSANVTPTIRPTGENGVTYDLNKDGLVNVLDILKILAFLF